MPLPSYLILGQNPEREAQHMQNLCAASAREPEIVSEFSETINFYISRTLSEAEERIKQRFSDGSAAGTLISSGGDIVGLASANSFDTAIHKKDEFIPAANVSIWILKAFRNQGIGRQALLYISQVAVDRTLDESDPDWFNRKIWTGIRDDNTASQKMCNSVGFTYANPDPYHEGRSIYTLNY